jgi:hypothetical protein
MTNVITERPMRTALTLAADDGTVATVRRVEGVMVFGLTPRLRMYRVYIMPVDKTSSEVTVSRPLLKQMLRGGAKITGRVA